METNQNLSKYKKDPPIDKTHWQNDSIPTNNTNHHPRKKSSNIGVQEDKEEGKCRKNQIWPVTH
jgi:hypothetical protein